MGNLLVFVSDVDNGAPAARPQQQGTKPGDNQGDNCDIGTAEPCCLDGVGVRLTRKGRRVAAAKTKYGKTSNSYHN
ncbi:MAG: hypothetical protein EHM48_10525 [Planctomycetaceae bacterium]|nr:MAG: hypothetical protein EHM48_10525 [Planctomycetaceae bacterium]